MRPARSALRRLLPLLAASVTSLAACDDAPTTGAPPLAARQPGGKTPPTLTSLTPASASLGSADLRVTLAGSGFAKSASVSVVRGAGTTFSPSVTFVSASELRVTLPAAELASPATLQVSVVNPASSGGASAPLAFEVRSPLPVATSLSRTTVAQGSRADTVVVITGSGFFTGSVATFDGAARVTRLIGPTQVAIYLTTPDVGALGAHAIAVANPAPGGGTSAGLPFTVVEAPRIVGLPSSGAHVGGSGLSLAVDGASFPSDAVVQWNGVDRPTMVRGSTRLVASIAAADVAAPGTASVRVRSASLGHVTTAVPVTVRAVPAPQLTSAVAVGVRANGVAYDSASALLYASVASSDPAYPNAVVAVDPLTGAVVKSVFVGSEPEFLALSDDGQYLYVSLRGSSSVRRVSLATFTPELEFALGANVVVEEMLVVPGQPRDVVLSKMYLGISPRHGGVFRFADGVQRPDTTPGHTGSNSLAFSGRSASQLYGYNNETTEFGFRSMQVDASGVRVSSTTTSLMSGFYFRIWGAGGRVYGADGSIIDPELRVRTGQLAANALGSSPSVLVDPSTGRALYLVAGTLTAFDLNTMAPLASLRAPGTFSAHPYALRRQLVRWGNDGLAYTSDEGIQILRTPLAAR